jgi:hypothetical protein
MMDAVKQQTVLPTEILFLVFANQETALGADRC